MKKFLSFVLVATALGVGLPTKAQNIYWTFDDGDREAIIPSQCDGQFDEARGGVFMPTPEELYAQGELFLLDKGPNRMGAGYCLISAALQGHVGAQLRLAQLYNKGLVLPQDDLSAYKWAFISSLNGSKEGERLALMLESFMSTEDIQLATASIQNLLPEMKKLKNEKLAEEEKNLNTKKAELEKINQEIDSLLGIPVRRGRPSPVPSSAASSAPVKPASVKDLPVPSFNETDRYTGITGI